MTIWFAADHHFQHAKILTFTDVNGKPLRPEFKNIQDHDNYIITQHNKLVKDDDLVYFLGDVSWKANSITREILQAMKGRKRLVGGNHDDLDFLMGLGVFEKHYTWKYFPEHNLIASHMPIAERDLKRAKFNVHGHLHEKVITKNVVSGGQGEFIDYSEVPDLRYLNVSMERTKYRPFSLETVITGVTE